MSLAQESTRFNTYDIFATFLPGAVAVMGVIAPHPATPNYFTSVTIAGLLVWTLVSFVAGLFVQALSGYLISGEESFERHMDRVVSLDRDDEIVTIDDILFLEAAREQYGYDAKFDDWKRLYRVVVTHLENNPPSRAIRIQTLFLALRGIVVALLITLVTTAAYGILVFNGVITSWFPLPLLVVIWVVTVGACVFGYLRAREFSDDVVSYMITEFRAAEPS